MLFLLVMLGLRVALGELKATHNTALIASICLPGIGLLVLFGWWMDRKGY